jgi:hypothetical protein
LGGFAVAPTGRPPKPIEQHKRTGTFDASRHKRGPLVAVAPVDDAPHERAPADLFLEIMDAGSAWFARTDGIQLSMLRESLEERARLLPVAEASTEARKQLRELNREIADWLTALGFNPTARARLGLAEVKAASTLERLQAKRDK